MGLGSTAKKVQQMVEMGEELYKKLNELREQVTALRATVEDTGQRVEQLERENAKQRALLTALAEKEDVDVEAVLAEVESSEDETTEDEPEETPDAVDNNP